MKAKPAWSTASAHRG